MNDIILKVTANRLEIEKDTYTTGGSINYDGCIFSFDSTWDGFRKTVVFGFGNSDYARVELESDSCKIPAICLKDEGILKIAVYGVNDDGVVITTNAVAHQVNEGLGEVNNWYEEDNLFVYNAIKELEGSLEKYKSGLDSKFSDLMKMVRRKGSVSDSDVLLGEPSDWYRPTMFADSDNIPSTSGKVKYQVYLDYILNKLVLDYPEYVSCKEFGTDASGEYPLYVYTFKPLDYEKTIFVTGCFHAENDITLLALSYFLDELCRNFKNDRTLAYLRSKVKFVVVPVCNPYGFEKKSKLNANGVDLQRNFNYKWGECSSEIKGRYACDQSETYAISYLLEDIFEDKFCAALDLSSGNNYYCGKMLFYPRFKDNCLGAIAETLNRYNFEKEEDDVLNKTILAASINPSIGNYIAENFNVNACSILWSPINYTGNGTDGRITKYTELIGNVLLTLAKNSSYTTVYSELPFMKHFTWRSNNLSSAHRIMSSQEKVPISAFEFDVKNPCCMSLSGYVILQSIDTCEVKINPVLWQENSPEQTYDERLATDEFSINLPLNEGVYVIPIETVLQAYVSDTNTQFDTVYPGKVKFTLVAQADAYSVACITGFSFTLRAYESDAAKPIQISRPMGRADDYVYPDDIPTQEILYPKETVAQDDATYND